MRQNPSEFLWQCRVQSPTGEDTPMRAALRANFSTISEVYDDKIVEGMRRTNEGAALLEIIESISIEQGGKT